MNASCDRCTCGGLGTCLICCRIRAVVAAESAPPARRGAQLGPATAAEFLATAPGRRSLLTTARRALDSLTVLQRQVLVLRLVGGLPAWRVGSRLGLPSSVVPGLVDAAEAKLSNPGREVTP